MATPTKTRSNTYDRMGDTQRRRRGPYRTPRLQWGVRGRGGGRKRTGRVRGAAFNFLATDNEGDGEEEGGEPRALRMDQGGYSRLPTPARIP